MREISSLRSQLRRVAMKVLQVTLPSSLQLPPPSSSQEMLLQQIVAAGLLDRIAMLAPAGTFAIPSKDVDNDTRRSQLRRLRAAYQSSTINLQRTPLFIPRTSFVSQREIRRLPTFVCYNDIVTSGEDSKRTVHMRGVTLVSREWLPAITVGTELCEFPPPAATETPKYNVQQDTMTCVTRPRFGPHRWELPLTTVPLSRTTIGVEQECRWFLRSLLEGKVVGAHFFVELRKALKISPAIITHSRFHGLGLQLVNAALEHDVVSLKALQERLKVDRRFMERALKMWSKNTEASGKVERLWSQIGGLICA